MLGIGLVGAHPDRGWARISHVPAIHATPGVRLAGVASRRVEVARAAATAFGADRAYATAQELVESPDVDVVAVVTTVPGHHDLVAAAAAAGKHVVTEWPVGTSTAETATLTEVTDAVVAAVGLQARRSPAVLAARELLPALGRLHRAEVLSTTAAFGPVVAADEVGLEDPGTGMTLRTIHLAHTLDLLGHLLGPLEVEAVGSTRHPTVLADGVPLRRRIHDHFALSGRAGGVPVTGTVEGGRPADDTPFRLVLSGERGRLELDGGAPRGFQTGTLWLSHDGRAVTLPAVDLPDPAVNVAGVYAALRDDVRDGTRTAPSFADALALSRVVDRVG
jgi:predicted dehydrogenase